jgi:hypothetical protein
MHKCSACQIIGQIRAASPLNKTTLPVTNGKKYSQRPFRLHTNRVVKAFKLTSSRYRAIIGWRFLVGMLIFWVVYANEAFGSWVIPSTEGHKSDRTQVVSVPNIAEKIGNYILNLPVRGS